MTMTDDSVVSSSSSSRSLAFEASKTETPTYSYSYHSMIILPHAKILPQISNRMISPSSPSSSSRSSPPPKRHLRLDHRPPPQSSMRRRHQRQNSWSNVHRLGVIIGILALGAFGTSTTKTVVAAATSAASSVEGGDSSASLNRNIRRQLSTNNHPSRYQQHRRDRFVFDDDDDDNDDTAATSTTGGVSESESGASAPATVCESVIAIASTRLFHSDENSEEVDENESRLDGTNNTSRWKNRDKRSSNNAEEGGEEFVCELITGDTVPISATPQQVDELRLALADGSLVSAVSTIAVQEVTVVTTTTIANEDGGGEGTGSVEVEELEQEVVDIAMMEEDMVQDVVQEVIASSENSDGSGSSRFIESVSLPPGSIQLQTEGTARKRRQLREQQQRQREVASYTGAKPVLVVRVTDVNGLAPTGDAHFMSDKFFGTYGDTETMVSQFASCSYGAYQIVTQQYPQMSAPGVLDVWIPISIQNSARDAIRKAVHSAVSAKLGFNAQPGPFAHVLYVVEKCYVDCGWAAYAYVNSWLSVYHSNYFMYPAVSLHEIGHNLNMGHSGGLDGKTYTDHSCLMGNPLFSDNTADMCYNPAKTHQLIMSNGKNGHSGNWYDASRVSTWTPGGSGSMWSRQLVGVAEYGQINNDGGGGDRRLVLRIVTGGSTDLYVGFNRKTGMNEDNKQGSDMVTVIQAGAGGITYSTSSLKATLQQGRSYYIPNWRGDGSSLEIFADEIRTNVVPGYAVVRAVIGGGNGPANPPTNPPTRVPPTPRPTRPPTHPPTHPPSPLPTLEPSDNPSVSPTFPPTPNPTPDPTISPTYPPSPLKDNELASGLDTSGKRSRGIMFTVTAKDHDVIITGMDAISRRNMPSDIVIFTKPGTYHTTPEESADYSSLEMDLQPAEWQEIYRGVIPAQFDKLVALDDFTASVTIAAGQTQSFYAYVSNGLLFTAPTAADSSTEGGTTGDAVAVEDEGIIIYEGQVMRGLFQKVVGLGRWGGVIRYRLA